MDLDPLCKPKHNPIHCWHCLQPMTMTKNYALIKDSGDSKDYDNVSYNYSCSNHLPLIIKYNFLEHKGKHLPGYYYVCYKTIEVITNIYSGKTWIQPAKQFNDKFGDFKNWFVFYLNDQQLLHKIKTYITFY